MQAHVRALIAGRHAEEIPIALGKMRRGHKAANHRQLDNRNGRLHQQLARTGQAQLEVIARWRAVQVLLEHALQLAAGHVHVGGQFVEVDGFFQVGFHQGDHFLQLGLLRAEQVFERHALVVALVANALVHEHLGNRRRQRVPVIAADQVQHHVQRRSAARAGKAVAIEREYAGADFDAGKRLLHRRHQLPMHAALEAIEQPRLGQCPTAGAHRAETFTVQARLAAQPGDERRADSLLDAHAAAHDHRIEAALVLGASIRGHRHAIAGPHRLAVQAQGLPTVEFFARQLVGHAQRLDRT